MTATLVLSAAPSYVTAQSITAGSEVPLDGLGAGAPASNLATPIVSETWRTGTLDSSKTWVAWDFGVPRLVAGAALPNTNATPDARWRLRQADAPIQGAETVTLDYSQPSWPGQIGTDVYGPVGDTVTLAVGQGWGAAFGAPTQVPAAGPNRQRFRVRIRSTGASPGELIVRPVGGAGGGQPVVSGVLLDNILETTRPATGVVEVLWSYDSWLGPGDVNPGGPLEGVGIYFEVRARPDGHPGDAWVIEAADWQADAGVYAVDTGYIPMRPNPKAFGGVLADLAIRPVQVDAMWAALDAKGCFAPVRARYGRIDIIDTLNPSGYVEAGRLAAGPGIALELQRDFGVWVEDPTTYETSTGGNMWRHPAAPWIAARLPIVADSAQGAIDLFQALYLYQGRVGDFGVSILPHDPDAAALSFWATLAADAALGIDYRQAFGADSPQQWSWGSSLSVRQVR